MTSSWPVHLTLPLLFPLPVGTDRLVSQSQLLLYRIESILSRPTLRLVLTRHVMEERKPRSASSVTTIVNDKINGTFRWDTSSLFTIQTSPLRHRYATLLQITTIIHTT